MRSCTIISVFSLVPLVFIECSSSGGAGADGGGARNDGAGGVASEGGDSAAMVPFDGGDSGSSCPPAGANTFNVTTGYGCEPSVEGCVSGYAGYGLTCFGTNATNGAPSPSASLNGNIVATPTNIENAVHFCCPCVQ